jgi:hypothetical protein
MTTLPTRFEHPAAAGSFAGLDPLVHRLAVMLRFWRRHRRRTHNLARTVFLQDARLRNDIGMAPLPPSSIEVWWVALLHHYRP